MTPGIGFSLGLDTMIAKVSTMGPVEAEEARRRASELQSARKAAGLSLADAATLVGLTEIEYQALESATRGYLLPDGWDKAIATLAPR